MESEVPRGFLEDEQGFQSGGVGQGRGDKAGRGETLAKARKQKCVCVCVCPHNAIIWSVDSGVR